MFAFVHHAGGSLSQSFVEEPDIALGAFHPGLLGHPAWNIGGNATHHTNRVPLGDTVFIAVGFMWFSRLRIDFVGKYDPRVLNRAK